MKDSKDNEMLMEVVDNYDVVRPSTRKLLKTLIQLAKDNCSIKMGIRNLGKMSKTSVPTVYRGLEILEKDGFIKKVVNINPDTGIFINTITVKPENLNKIIKHVKLKENSIRIRKKRSKGIDL